MPESSIAFADPCLRRRFVRVFPSWRLPAIASLVAPSDVRAQGGCPERSPPKVRAGPMEHRTIPGRTDLGTRRQGTPRLGRRWARRGRRPPSNRSPPGSAHSCVPGKHRAGRLLFGKRAAASRGGRILLSFPPSVPSRIPPGETRWRRGAPPAIPASPPPGIAPAPRATSSATESSPAGRPSPPGARRRRVNSCRADSTDSCALRNWSAAADAACPRSPAVWPPSPTALSPAAAPLESNRAGMSKSRLSMAQIIASRFALWTAAIDSTAHFERGIVLPVASRKSQRSMASSRRIRSGSSTVGHQSQPLPPRKDREPPDPVATSMTAWAQSHDDGSPTRTANRRSRSSSERS